MPFIGPTTRTEDLGLSKLNGLDSQLGQAIGVGVASLPTPGQPVCTVQGVQSGSTVYAYAIVATHVSPGVGDSSPSIPTVVLNGPATLTATNNVLVQWNPVPGANSYKILRVTIATGVYNTLSNALAISSQTLSYTDNGVGTLSAYTPILTPPLLPSQDAATFSTYTVQAAQAGNTAIGSTVRNILTGLGIFRSALLIETVTVAGTGAGSTTLYLQGSSDGGTTWADLLAFAAITNAQTTTQRSLGQLADNALPANPQLETTSDQSTTPTLAAATFKPGPWGDRLRVVEVVTATWTTAPTFVITGSFSS